MDIYLKMVTNRDVMVKGGSKDADHVDWIEVLTFDRVYDRSVPPFTSEIRLMIVGSPAAELWTLATAGVMVPTVILDVPARREWYLFREAVVSQLRPIDRDDGPVITLMSFLITGAEHYPGAYAPTAAAAQALTRAAAQATKALTRVTLARLRRFLTK